jgi:hypothetical protein
MAAFGMLRAKAAPENIETPIAAGPIEDPPLCGAGGGATVVGLTDLRESTPADSAFEESREQIAWAARSLGANAFVLGHDLRPGFLLSLLHQVPKLVVNNPQVRNLGAWRGGGRKKSGKMTMASEKDQRWSGEDFDVHLG